MQRIVGPVPGNRHRNGTVTRRGAMVLSGGAAMAAGLPAAAQDTTEEAPAEAAPQSSDLVTDGQPFDYDRLTDEMRRRATGSYEPPATVEREIADLTYDEFRRIQVNDERARWAEDEGRFRLLPYHVGWLFQEPVTLHEVVDGTVRPMDFSTEDFIYPEGLGFEDGETLPGVAGFRLNFPLNTAGKYDEVISFLGASYFRALGMGNLYGLSARGVAVNSGLPGGEEFPRFSDFWMERPAPDARSVTIWAALDSPSLTGAYRFVVSPGRETVMEVEARLFFREGVEQLGMAPLTSMYFLGPNDHGFDDYRPRVHDSDTLVMDAGEGRLVRPLQNPPRIANSYLGAVNPRAFGLLQRTRGFDQYLDVGAGYEKRPSLLVEPIGDWGSGTLRLIEFPTDLETNDNIVAFWIPEQAPQAGGELTLGYRLHWGTDVLPDRPELAQIERTLAGMGGVAGVEPKNDRRKFVIDFSGGHLMEPDLEETVQENVSASGGEITQSILEHVGGGLWRLVIEVTGEPGNVVEMKAALEAGTERLSETWLYQWMPE